MLSKKMKLRVAFFTIAFLGILLFLGKNKLFAENQLFPDAILGKKFIFNNYFGCSLEKEAQAYINDIYKSSPDHFGVSKPMLNFNVNDSLYKGNRIVVGEENGQTITIYEKGFVELYGKKCPDDVLVHLQSTIAHEYAHHIDHNSGIIRRSLGTNDLEYSAKLGGENALFELVWNQENPKAAKLDEKEKEEIKRLKELLKKY